MTGPATNPQQPEPAQVAELAEASEPAHAAGERPLPSGGQPVPASPTRDGRRTRPSGRRRATGWLAVVLVAVVVAVVVRAFVAESYFIPSGSMIPTLDIGDRIVVDKLSFDFHPVEQGDIVVFSRPPTWPVQYKDLVKRVIGLPGQVLWVHDGDVYVDGRPIAQPWLPATMRNETLPGPVAAPYNLAHPYRVPAGDYFVMGDNRTVSADSRYYGPVPARDIVGGVVFRYWPLSRIGSL